MISLNGIRRELLRISHITYSCLVKLSVNSRSGWHPLFCFFLGGAGEGLEFQAALQTTFGLHLILSLLDVSIFDKRERERGMIQ